MRHEWCGTTSVRQEMSERPSDVVIPATPTPPRDKSLSRRSPGCSVAFLRSRSEELLSYLVTAADIIAAASQSVLTTFKATDPLAPCETVILAEWIAPSGFTIQALSISPDAAVIALILADELSAVLTLLRPRSLSCLLRVALPWSKDVCARQVFFSQAALTLSDDQKLRQNMLPQHLQAAFLEMDKQTSQRSAFAKPCRPQKERAAPFSIAIALDLLLVYSFSSCYTRIHTFSSHRSPNSSAELMSLPTLPTKDYTPVLHDNTFLHTLQSPLLPISDLRVVKLLALCRKPPALLALAQLPSRELAASVFHEHSVMITPLIVRDSRGILFAHCGTGGYILETSAQEVCRIADISFDKSIGLRVSVLPRKKNEQGPENSGREAHRDQLSCVVHHNDSVIKILAIHNIIHIEALPCKLPFL